MRSFSTRLSTAFYGLHHALNLESLPESIVQDEDHAAYIRRTKQLRSAAHIVLGLWEALKKGPNEALTKPLNWARDIAGGPFLPAHPKRKLSAAKDYLVAQTEHGFVAWASRVRGELPVAVEGSAEPDLEIRKVAALLLAEKADALRTQSQGRSPSTGASPAVAPGSLGYVERGTLAEFAFLLAVDLRDPFLKVINDLLPGRTLGEAARLVEQALIMCDQATFLETEALLLKVLVGLGLSPKVAHDFFSYRNKRAKRPQRA